MSFRSFDICPIVWFFWSSSSFISFCAIVLALSREALAFPTCVTLGPVVVLTLLILHNASLSRTSSVVTLSSSAGLCPIISSLFGGVSGITVPDRGSTVIWGGVASIVGVLRG